MQERRETWRYDVALVAEVDADGETLSATSRNLSLTGVGLMVPRPLTVGCVVTMQLFLLEQHTDSEMTGPLELGGEVVWMTGRETGNYEVGVQFARLSETQQRWLERFIERLGGVGHE